MCLPSQWPAGFGVSKEEERKLGISGGTSAEPNGAPKKGVYRVGLGCACPRLGVDVPCESFDLKDEDPGRGERGVSREGLERGQQQHAALDALVHCCAHLSMWLCHVYACVHPLRAEAADDATSSSSSDDADNDGAGEEEEDEEDPYMPAGDVMQVRAPSR